MAKKRKSEPRIVDVNGNEIVRRYETRYWFGNRNHRPSPFGRGFPRFEDGSAEGVGKLALKGWITKAQCFDRVTGKVKWTVLRGERVPGTHLYNVIIKPGDAE